ncbi:CinA family protein [Salinibius halmophilus]|uniref:CinA family protein n=1 Tax=Salinibius halmophilus TaxID=1853216 RepID=UPI000E672343|nr:nicotinamide-nucleotide amidohydrolase family protein [Salinibius halmophilus]
MTQLIEQAEKLANLLTANHQTMVTAESCTGGLVATTLTELAGSSAWFLGAWVTYANEAKSGWLGVDANVIKSDGAVSQPVVAQMCAGALANSDADWAIAISGVAGPGGGTAEKPVGTVWIAVLGRGKEVIAEKFLFAGDRAKVRQQAALQAMTMLVAQLSNK